MVEKKRLINNSLSGVIQLIITALLTFFCIPVFINKLGTDLYGVFAIVSVIGNLNVFTNLGLDSSLTKFIAEQGKDKGSNLDILASFILTICTVLPVSLLCYFFRKSLLLDILNIPSEYFEQAESLFYFLLISNAILLIGQNFAAILNALQRIYITNIIQLTYSIIYWLGIIILVLIGKNLKSIGLIILCASIVWFSLNMFFAFKHWGYIDLDVKFAELKKHAKKQISYGSRLYTSGVIAFFNEPLFKIIISFLGGMSAVAYYEIALRIRGQLSGVFNKLMQPLFPYFAEVKDSSNISKLVYDLSLKILLLVIPVCALLLLCSYDIVVLWLKIDVENYAIFINGIVIPYLLFSPITLPIYLYLIAKGYPERTIVFQLLSVIVNVFVFCVLFNFCGIYTVILSNCFAYLASYLLGLYYQKKMLNISYHFRWTIAIKYLILILTYSICGLIIYFVHHEILSIIIAVMLVLLSTVWCYKHLHLVEKEDIVRYFSDNVIIHKIYNLL